MKYKVHIAPQAEEQLRDITFYIAKELQAPSAALSILNELEEAIGSLDLFPDRIPLTQEEPWHKQGIHKMTVKSFLVYFWIDEDAHIVHVTAVIYGKREQRNQLFRVECYGKSTSD